MIVNTTSGLTDQETVELMHICYIREAIGDEGEIMLGDLAGEIKKIKDELSYYVFREIIVDGKMYSDTANPFYFLKSRIYNGEFWLLETALNGEFGFEKQDLSGALKLLEEHRGKFEDWEYIKLKKILNKLYAEATE